MSPGFRVVGSGAAVIAAMVVGRLITDHLPVEADHSPFYREVAVGETARLDYTDLTAYSVKAADFIDGSDITLARGTFLVVDVRARGHHDSGILPFVSVVDAHGRTYDPTDRGSSCDTSIRAWPGVTTYARFCFDVPPEELEGMHLQLGRGGKLLQDSQRRDEVADVDLRISASDARELAGARIMLKGKTSDDIEKPSEEELPPPSGAPEEAS